MRKQARIENTVEIATIDGYHSGDYEQNLIFASDRPSKATWDYRLEDGSVPSMIGAEIELQNWGISKQTILASILHDVIFKLFPNNLFKMERDSSLSNNCDSYAECITQPMTKAFIRNHYKDFKTMYDTYFPNFGISCSDTGDCGMHLHISTTCFGSDKAHQDEAIRKFYYIINRHYDFFVSALFRNPLRTGYCRRMTKTNFDRYEYDAEERWYHLDFNNAKNLDFDTMRLPNDHGYCINLSHYEHNNIELRLVGGQKNFACFRNTMETVFHVLKAVKTLKWEQLEDITKIFSGCNQYVFNRLKTFVRESGQITVEQLAKIERTVKRENLL